MSAKLATTSLTSRQANGCFRVAEWLIDRLNSRNEITTAIAQLSCLIPQIPEQSIGDFYVRIGDLIFRKTAQIQPETSRGGIWGCAELCYSLHLVHLRKRSDPSPVAFIHEHVFRLCMDALYPENFTEPLSPKSPRDDGEISVEKNSELLYHLWDFQLISVGQICKYIRQVTQHHTSSIDPKLTDAGAGVYMLLNSCLLNYSDGPWKSEVESFREWIETCPILDGIGAVASNGTLRNIREEEIMNNSARNSLGSFPSISHNEPRPGIRSEKPVQMGITTDTDDRLTGSIIITAAAPKSAANTPPSTVPAHKKKKKVNVYNLFQGGGIPPATTPTPISSGQCSTELERHGPNSHDFLFLSNYSHPPPPPISKSVGMRSKRLVPGPLNLTHAWKSHGAAPLPALVNARIIEDLNTVPYPRTVQPPNPDFDFAIIPGKFRYNREFLLQFMGVCKEQPDSLPALDMMGLEPNAEPNAERSDRRRVGSLSIDNAPALQRQASIGLGLGSARANRRFAMGDFQSPTNSRFGVNNAMKVDIPIERGAGGRIKYPTRKSNQGGSYPGKPDGGNLDSEAYVTRSPTRANDRPEFGKIQKPTGIRFGTSSVFSKQGSKIGRGGEKEMKNEIKEDVKVSLPSHLDKVKTGEMADRISVYGKPGVPPRELLIKAFDQMHHKQT